MVKMILGESNDHLELNQLYWNDKGYRCTFSIEIWLDGEMAYEGHLKIAKKGMTFDSKNVAYAQSDLTVDLPQSDFYGLDKEVYYSMGVDEDYYKFFAELPENKSKQKEAILTGLNDIIFDPSLFDRFKEEKAMRFSLMRDVSKFTMDHDFSAVLNDNQVQQTPYEIIIKKLGKDFINFSVKPESIIQSNLHCIIGRNGSGKSHLFKQMIQKIVYDENDLEVIGKNQISTVLVMNFSVFDTTLNFDPDKTGLEGVQYSFIGLGTDIESRKEQTKQNLTQMFEDSIENIFTKKTRETMLSSALGKLTGDPLFKEMDIVTRFNSQNRMNIQTWFDKLSAGHRIVLLGIVSLVEKIQANSIVLLDEPELHLHPPLIAAYMEAVVYILSFKNSLAIAATHSPVIVQEVPKNAVWIINRHLKSDEVTAIRPNINTYGQSFEKLNSYIFGLEVSNSGYMKDVVRMSESVESFNNLVMKYNDELGDNALTRAAMEFLE